MAGIVVGENALMPGDILKNKKAMKECKVLGKSIADKLLRRRKNPFQ